MSMRDLRISQYSYSYNRIVAQQLSRLVWDQRVVTRVAEILVSRGRPTMSGMCRYFLTETLEARMEPLQKPSAQY